MIDFEYLQPSSIEDASKLNKNSASILYAGGTDVLGLMKDNIVYPEKIINLKKISNLNKINIASNGTLRIGALTKLSDIANNDFISSNYKTLALAAAGVATPQIRNMGTIGGNICQRPRCFYFRGDFDCLRKGGDECFAFDGHNKYHCIIGGGPCYIVHPSDTAVALLALDASLNIYTGKEYKSVKLKDFFVLPEENSYKENILNPGEIITEIVIPPIGKNYYSNYIKVTERGAWDFALVSVASVIGVSKNQIKSAKFAFGGIAPIPWMDEKFNSKANNLTLTENNINSFTNSLLTDAEPLEMNKYKLQLARNLLRKTIESII